MKNNITVKAPGKLVLFGEHAVVAGYSCIVSAVDQYVTMMIESIPEKQLHITAPDVGIENYTKNIHDLGIAAPKETQFIEYAVKFLYQTYGFTGGWSITTASDFGATIGLGSSSAVVVAVVSGITTLLGLALSKKELFALSKKIVLSVQKKGSGVDVAAAVYGGTVLFRENGNKIHEIVTGSLPMVVGYTGIKADTVHVLTEVAKKFENNHRELTDIYKKIDAVVMQAEKVLQRQDLEKVGAFMHTNQLLLQRLGVSSVMIESLITAANNAGAFGAKLSGAGMGDCVIALVSPDNQQQVAQAIRRAGGEILDISCGAKGVHSI